MAPRSYQAAPPRIKSSLRRGSRDAGTSRAGENLHDRWAAVKSREREADELRGADRRAWSVRYSTVARFTVSSDGDAAALASGRGTGAQSQGEIGEQASIGCRCGNRARGVGAARERRAAALCLLRRALLGRADPACLARPGV